jgi:hypothetical protein
MIDHPVLMAIQDHLQRNMEAYLALASAITIAGVCMMPKNRPKSIDDWWTWLRDTLQTAVPAARAQREVHSLTETTTPTASTKQEVTATTAADPTQPKQGA